MKLTLYLASTRIVYCQQRDTRPFFKELMACRGTSEIGALNLHVP